MKLQQDLVEQLIRLGGVPPSGAWEDTVWPKGKYNASGERIRSQYPEYRDLDEYAIYDPFHPVRELTFVESVSKGFWDNWDEGFTSVDPAIDLPFAADEAYFFFIYQKNQDGQYMVSMVDHETVDEEPYRKEGLSLAVFLSILEKAPGS